MGSRKRSRNEDEEDQSVPISKRINRLQLGHSSGDLNENGMMGETSQEYMNQVHMGNSVGQGMNNGVNNMHNPGTSNGNYQQHQPHQMFSPHHQHQQHHQHQHQQSPQASPSSPNPGASSPNHSVLAPSQSSPLPHSYHGTPPYHAHAGAAPGTELSPLHEPYAPELSAAENPQYYSMNRVLYEAHVERLRRLPFGGPRH